MIMPQPIHDDSRRQWILRIANPFRESNKQGDGDDDAQADANGKLVTWNFEERVDRKSEHCRE